MTEDPEDLIDTASSGACRTAIGPRTLRADALAGLTATPKTLPPKWFYDERGSELFEKITELPEYYPTRAERSILAAVGPRDRRASPARRRWWSSAPARRRRPGCCSTPARPRHAAQLRAGGRQRVGADRPPATRWLREYPGLPVQRGRSRTSRQSLGLPSPTATAGGRGWSPSSARTIGNMVPARAGRVPGPGPAQLRAGRRVAARHRPGQGPGGARRGLRRLGRGDRRVQQERARRAQRRARRGLRPGRVRPRRGLGRRARVDRDAAALDGRPDRAGAGTSG